MNPLSDAAVERLRGVSRWPEFADDRYNALEQIGRGGMGTVYLAVDRQLGREVAVKVPHDSGSASLERRLRLEARVLARLEHPGIIPIHDVGRLADGRLFYVMKLVRGRTLLEHTRGLAELTERLRVFERVCEPVAFAHAHGCIHRDLKPENIMIGSFGEVMVMDWGVASTPDAQEYDADATVVGTRGFMSPEQARATPGIDQRADVYSLGAILYLMLTGDDPAAHRDPASAIQLRRELPRPLRSICARALASSADGRYGTVTDLAEDVSSFSAGLPVRAHKENIAESTIRLARKYRIAILLVLAYIVMRALVALAFRR